MESFVTPEGTENVWVLVPEVERVTVLAEVVITRAQRVSEDCDNGRKGQFNCKDVEEHRRMSGWVR